MVKSPAIYTLGMAICCAVAPVAAQCPTPQPVPVYSTGKQAITLPDPHWWLVQTPMGTGPFAAYVTDNTGFPFASWVAVTADLGGNVSGSVRIPITPLGAYNLEALGQTSGTAPAATFAVTPRLVINPTTGRIGDTINVQSFGFAAGEIVDIGWNNPRIPLVTVAVDSTGSSGVLTFVIPAGPALGPNLIAARGRTSLAIGSVAITLQ